MKSRRKFEDLEPERYELSSPPLHAFKLEWTRRGFVATVGGGLSVALVAGRVRAQQESGARGRGNSVPQEVSAWLHFHEDGRLSVFTGKAEVGQNARTSLTQSVADELDFPPARIELVMGDTDRVPYDRGTFGSQTTPVMIPQLRRAAAAARQAILELASRKWGLDASELRFQGGLVQSRDGSRSAHPGELTRGEKLSAAIARDQAVRAPEDWRLAGRSLPKVNGVDFVTGAHRYATDYQLPGMLYGKVLRPPAYNAVLSSVDTSRAAAMSGVKVVVDKDFVGVAAPSSEQAEAAVKAIRAEWKTSEQPSRKGIFDYLKNHPTESAGGFGGRSERTDGSVEEGLSQSDKVLSRSYTVEYIAHVPLEPRAAVAQWEGEKLTVWTSTQRPFGVRDELVEAFGLASDKVRVIMPDAGSGYGGKHTGEAALEAARLARAAGRPVKLAWTREEEFSWAYFRPAGLIEVRSGARHDGRLLAWDFHNYNSGSSALQGLYEVPNQTIRFHPTEYPLRQGSYRGLAATANHFARETHIDEMAGELGLDPVQFRLQNLKDDRQAAVLKAVAERAGWGKTLPAGRARGIACGFEKRGYVATCAEIQFDESSREIRILRLTTAFECGKIVNPDGLRNQVEGSVVMGLGGALFEFVDFDNGQIRNPLLSLYRIPRFRDLPELETVLLDRPDIPSAGAGETPIVCVAPAIGNAIFKATGIRLRSLPLIPQGLPDQA